MACPSLSFDVKTEPLLTESMGGAGKIFKKEREREREVSAKLPLSLSSCFCQLSGKTPPGPDTVKKDRKKERERENK